MSFRIVKILPVCLAVASLAGCGNPDYGKEFRPGGKPASQAASTEPAAQQAAVAPEAWGPCKTMYVYSGTGAAYSSELANSKACPGVANKSAARLKVSAYFPTTRRACLVPLNSGAAYPATCFTINGEKDITLNTASYTALTLVYETDLAAYTSYLNNQSNTYPALAFAAVR